MTTQDDLRADACSQLTSQEYSQSPGCNGNDDSPILNAISFVLFAVMVAFIVHYYYEQWKIKKRFRDMDKKSDSK
jgi:hypothetical protein